MITRKALPRRTFLRGMGTAVALPFLDAMVPALAAPPPASRRCAWRSSTCRTASTCATGIPTYEGKLGELPRILKPLEPFKDDIAAARQPDPQHRPRAARWRGRSRPLLRLLPHRHPGQEEHSVDIKAGVSMDQIVANQIGSKTRFPSLEVGLEDARQAGDCDSGYSCAYTNNLAWRARRSRCPRSSIRARCSSGCSATAWR